MQNASNPIEWQIATLDSPVDRIPIRYASWGALPSVAKRLIVLLNGRSEWIEKYGDLPLEANFGTDSLWVSLDHRGQGESGGAKAYVASYDDYARDVLAVIKAVHPQLPYLIVAHSMGSLIALYGTLMGHLYPSALVLCSPLFALPDKPVPKAIAKPLSLWLSKTKFRHQPTGAGTGKCVNFTSNPLTSSHAGFLKVKNSPHLYVSPTFGWVAASFAACRDLQDSRHIATLECPTLILGGAEETVVDAEAWTSIACLIQRYSPAPFRFQRIPKARHELLNEVPRVRRQCFSLMRDFLEHYRILPGLQPSPAAIKAVR